AMGAPFSGPIIGPLSGAQGGRPTGAAAAHQEARSRDGRGAKGETVAMTNGRGEDRVGSMTTSLVLGQDSGL
ncbi:MAG: hypothetical protein WKF38_06005, partial [Candidatus Limnocylindrales bacterium]